MGTLRTWLGRYQVESVVVSVSLLLSLWLISFDNVVNSDGILYLTSAERFVEGDWRTAIEIYRWPLYAWLISLVTQASGVNIDVAAYVINTIFYALLTFSFVAIVRTLNASHRTLWFAALFILILPALNGYRSFVIRDIGFWAFYLLALLAFFKFQNHPTFVRALSWGAAMLVAMFFRIEGVVFLLLMPMVVLWRPKYGWKTALRHFFELQAVALIGLLAAVLWFSASDAPPLSGRLLEPLLWLELFGKQVMTGLAGKADLLAQHLLNSYSEDFAMPGVLGILFLILLTHLAKGLSLLGVWAAANAWLSRAMPVSVSTRRALVWLIALNVAVLVVFVTEQFFLTGRYVMALALTIALYVPFGLNRIYETWRERRVSDQATGKWLFPVAAVLVAFMAIDSAWSFGSSKRYMKDAGRWLQSNIEAGAVYSNDEVVSYYAGVDMLNRARGRTDLKTWADDESWRRYDYLALVVKRNESIPETLLTAPVIRTFSNERNDRVLVFKTLGLRANP